jgi:hypothetical protein
LYCHFPKILVDFWNVFPVGKYIVCHWLLSRFFSSPVVFKSLIIVCFGVSFLGLSFLGVANLLGHVDWYFHQIWKCFQWLFPQTLFKPHSFFFPFDTSIIWKLQWYFFVGL